MRPLVALTLASLALAGGARRAQAQVSADSALFAVNNTTTIYTVNRLTGATAAAEFQVRAPLKEAGLTKAEIRELSAQFGLPIAIGEINTFRRDSQAPVSTTR